MSDSQQVPSVDQLQFHRAETATDGPAGQRCLACKQPIVDTYFHAAGHVVCPLCADRIQTGQQAPPASSLARAALFAVGAGLAGCAIYATVAIVTGLEIGLIAILVGIMVGKAIRYACGGLGGRPQQILAVVVTYFAITTSYIPVAIYQFAKHPAPVADGQDAVREHPSAGTVVVSLVVLAAAAPFMSLSDGSGILSLVIIFIGLRQAWKLTERHEILIMGPYTT